MTKAKDPPKIDQDEKRSKSPESSPKTKRHGDKKSRNAEKSKAKIKDAEKTTSKGKGAERGSPKPVKSKKNGAEKAPPVSAYHDGLNRGQYIDESLKRLSVQPPVDSLAKDDRSFGIHSDRERLQHAEKSPMERELNVKPLGDLSHLSQVPPPFSTKITPPVVQPPKSRGHSKKRSKIKSRKNHHPPRSGKSSSSSSSSSKDESRDITIIATTVDRTSRSSQRGKEKVKGPHEHQSQFVGPARPKSNAEQDTGYRKIKFTSVSLPSCLRCHFHATFLTTVRGITLMAELLSSIVGLISAIKWPTPNYSVAQNIFYFAYPSTFLISVLLLVRYLLCTTTNDTSVLTYELFLEIVYIIVWVIIYVVAIILSIVDENFSFSSVFAYIIFFSYVLDLAFLFYHRHMHPSPEAFHYRQNLTTRKWVSVN